MAEMRDIIIFATADWHAPYWTNKQHTAMQFAKMGYRVLYIESVGLRAPGVNAKDLRRLWRRLRSGLRAPREVAKNLWVMSPLVVPFKHHWSVTRAVNQRLLSLRINGFLRKQKFQQPLVWTYHPFIMDTLPQIAHEKLIYHCVDDLATVPGIDAEAFNREETRMLPECHAVFTTSDVLQEKCSRHAANTFHFPNVADVSHFGRARQGDFLPADLAAIPAPRIAYIGALSDYKVDFELILAVARTHPEWHWVLIGDEREGQQNAAVLQLRQLPNVHFLGYRSYAELPDYLRGMSVATLPTLMNEYTRAMFPMKYFEYLAAGVPVVSTPLEFTRQHSAGLIAAKTSEEFAAGIARQLERGKLRDDEIKEFVADNTWDARLKKMLEKI